MEHPVNLYQYASVCSGIEAVSVAWQTLGMTPAWFSEIEPFSVRCWRTITPELPITAT